MKFLNHSLMTIILASGASVALNILLIPFYTDGPDYSEYSLLLKLLLLGIAAPIIEEILFRLFLFGILSLTFNFLLRKRFKTKNIAADYVGSNYIPTLSAAVISSALFGFYHMNLVQGIYAFIMGMLMCYVFDTGYWIFSSCLFHITANITILLLGECSFFNMMPVLIISFIIAAALAVFAFIKIHYSSKYKMTYKQNGGEQLNQKTDN